MRYRDVRRLRRSLFAAVMLVGIASRIDTQSADAASDVTITATTCFVLDGMGNVVSGTRSGARVTLTTRDDGSVSGYCAARVAPPATGAAVELTYATTGARCTIVTDTGLLSTDNWRETISPDGLAELWCSAAAVAPAESNMTPTPAAPTSPARRCHRHRTR